MITRLLMIGGAVLLTASLTHRGPEVGRPAPTFEARDTRGRVVSLAAYRGKWVVLEWFNHACPYTRKHYTSDNMQRLQRAYTAKGVVWLSIVSSGAGREGFTTDAEANVVAEQEHAAPTAIIRDTAGVLGHLYAATNTPNMFVIDPRGVLVYSGAIDDKRTTDTADVKTAHNYVRAALDAAMAGRPVTVPLTQPYGCIIQYAE